MNPLPPANPSPGNGPPEPAASDEDMSPEAVQQRVKARIEYLFRYDLQRNKIHPLMHLVLRYRSEGHP